VGYLLESGGNKVEAVWCFEPSCRLNSGCVSMVEVCIIVRLGRQI
jgi:hypothetical protein